MTAPGRRRSIEASVGRKLPDPITLTYLQVARRRTIRNTAVIRFIPTDRIKQELVLSGAAINQRLSVHEVVREPGSKFWKEPSKCFRILVFPSLRILR